MKEGEQESLELENLANEISLEETTSSLKSVVTLEESESSFEAMGIALAQPSNDKG